ncbi:MAG: hypothetical protein DWQ07_07990 [Chloroflexi bacterium]|nr:MAG: hypothetical protein DWQ07_07990 [Chloroflexota bacterium]MBL1197021.1 hypothetical protein [Chloroflexota bacterium]
MLTEYEKEYIREFYKIKYTKKTSSGRLSHSWVVVWIFAVFTIVPVAFEFEDPSIYLTIIIGSAVLFTLHYLIVAKFYRDNLKTRRVLKIRLEFIKRAMFLEIMLLVTLGLLTWIIGYTFIHSAIPLPILIYSAISLPIYFVLLVVSWITSIHFLKFQVNEPVEKQRINRITIPTVLFLLSISLIFSQVLPPHSETFYPGVTIALFPGFSFAYGIYVFRCYLVFSRQVV